MTKKYKEITKIIAAQMAERICEAELPYYDADTQCPVCQRHYIFDEAAGCYVENCCCYDPELLPNGEERFQG